MKGAGSDCRSLDSCAVSGLAGGQSSLLLGRRPGPVLEHFWPDFNVSVPLYLVLEATVALRAKVEMRAPEMFPVPAGPRDGARQCPHLGLPQSASPGGHRRG